MKKVVAVFIILVLIGIMLTGCTQANRVSHNLSKEADSFNVTRKLTVINQRTDTILFEMIGNFSVQKSNGDLDIIGENDDGTYYKHFIYLSSEVTYVVQDLGKTMVNRHKYEINFNPKMIMPVEITTID